jgi:twitching motility protein PilT
MKIEEILRDAVRHGATDVHIIAGMPIMFRLAGDLRAIDDTALLPASTEELCYALLNEDQRAEFRETRDIDIIRTMGRNRFRINLSQARESIGAVIRVLNYSPMPLEDIGLPDVVTGFCRRDKGLVLITGTTSQGKTTTLAAMVDYINRHKKRHIVTIEDPIEYIHENKQSIVRQREVGRDTDSFEVGLKAALRQDPDVIVIGEMRDYDSIKIALTAAETGCLVLSTLHTMTTDKIIERLFSYVPSDQDAQIRMMLSEVLLGVVHQELLTTIAGRKKVACEILVNTQAVRHTLRRKETYYLKNFLQTGGKKYGMRTMQQSLDELLEADEITPQVYQEVLINYSHS